MRGFISWYKRELVNTAAEIRLIQPFARRGPLFAATVYDATGSYDLAFATFAAINVLAVLALLLVRCERAAEVHEVRAA